MLGDKLLIFQIAVQNSGEDGTAGQQYIGVPLTGISSINGDTGVNGISAMDVVRIVEECVNNAGPFAPLEHTHEQEIFIGKCVGGKQGSYVIEAIDGSGKTFHENKR
jgi:hypothetical protein